MKKIQEIMKRVFDFTASLMGLLCLSPLLLLIAIVIKIDSNGSVFFLQKRIGKNGLTFKIIKFRTMVENAEKIGDGLSVKNENDSRITKAGNLLRRTSLDELPQLINVFKGDMSLVGPRPPVVYHPYKGYNDYPIWAKKRFRVRPGITGLAQVKVRNSVSWDERIKLDIHYIENFNLVLDIKILWQTFMKLFNSDNIYMNK